jgi:hypothetical protein
MTRVFLGGSRKVSRLNDIIRKRLDEIVNRGMEVVVGDANGADRALQAYFADQRYPNVTVYYVGKAPRNNVGSWHTQRVETPPDVKGFEFYSAKDRVMADDADCGLMLWDASSRGTLANVRKLVDNLKPVAVYISKSRRFVNVRSEPDLARLLEGSGSPSYGGDDGKSRSEPQVTFRF